jgi:hypothetical protein
MSIPASGNSVASATYSALPVAVPRWRSKRSIASSSFSLSSVGGCTSAALPPNATMPMRAFGGRSSTNDFAAICAAVMRFGSTSVAPMLSDTSMARMIVCCCDGSVTRAVGRASAVIIATSDTSRMAGGRWRRTRSPGPIAALTRSRLE